MNVNEFNYDFKESLTQLMVQSKEQFEFEIKQQIGSDLNTSLTPELECIFKVIDLRYIQATNICTSLLKAYHQNLILWLNQSDKKY